MKCGLITKSLLAGTMLATMLGAAQAGGFARGTADTDILYEPGNFDMRAGVTFVNPTRKISSNAANPDLIGTSYTDSYAVPSIAFKVSITEAVACAGTYVQAYGGSVSYSVPKLPSGKSDEQFTVDEFGATCALKYGVGRGNAYILGGVFSENFNYDRVAFPSALGGARTDLALNGQDYGYRLGVAYDIPEIAFRTQLLYRSGTNYGATGTLIAGPLGSLAAAGTGNLPQSIELDVQSGIAPGWLAFASVKWTDWSVQNALVVTTSNPAVGSLDTYNWKDGWTITGGVGHAFNDTVSGLVSFTWDQGVGTGWDLSSDTWTLAAGAAVKDNLGGELRFGVGLSYLTSASENQYNDVFVPGSTDPRNGFNTAVDAGWAYAFNVGYKLNW
jgi:long-chain fatty acid transport protein